MKKPLKTSGTRGDPREKAGQAMRHLREQLAEIEELDRETSSTVSELQGRIVAVQEEAAAKRASLIEEASRLSEEIYSYAHAHRKEFTGSPEGKTGLFDAGGVVRWHHFQPSVVIEDEAKLVEYLKAHKLVEKFGKVTIEPSKSKILAKRDEAKKLPGVRLKPGRKFKVLAPGVVLQAHKDMEDPNATWEFVYPEKRAVST